MTISALPEGYFYYSVQNTQTHIMRKCRSVKAGIQLYRSLCGHFIISEEMRRHRGRAQINCKQCLKSLYLIEEKKKTKTHIDPQPPPIENGTRPIWEMVIEDMESRNKFGIEKYGTPLQAFDGRDSLIDAYQELLDFCVYIKKYIIESEEKEKR
jgi:hypothetical protein